MAQLFNALSDEYPADGKEQESVDRKLPILKLCIDKCSVYNHPLSSGRENKIYASEIKYKKLVLCEFSKKLIYTMSVNLCIDWGNTNIKAAIFENDSLAKSFVLSHDKAAEQVLNIIETHKPERAIISSVTAESTDFTTVVASKIKSLIKLDGFTRVPINNAYGTPETLGPDRLAMVVGAHAAFPDKTNLVICLGTCITYNVVLKTRTFRGGSISPGMQMRLKAMHEYTNKLPEVSIDGDVVLMGYDTESGIRSGAIYGVACEIDGMIAAYEKTYPDFNVILTGGDAPYFVDKFKSQIFADPDILLKGLNVILKYNV